MGHLERGELCETCGRQTLHRIPRPNHVLHFLISFFTCGAWLLVWAMLAIEKKPPICGTCGTVKLPPRLAPRMTEAETRRFVAKIFVYSFLGIVLLISGSVLWDYLARRIP